MLTLSHIKEAIQQKSQPPKTIIDVTDLDLIQKWPGFCMSYNEEMLVHQTVEILQRLTQYGVMQHP